jgi:hypothetical protein
MLRTSGICLFILSRCAFGAAAQYGDAYHAPNQMELNRQAAARQQAASDEHFRNIAPKSASSGSSPAPRPYGSYKKSAEEIAEERAEAEADRKLRARLAAEAEASEARYQARRYEMIKDKAAARYAFVREEVARNDDPLLTDLDKRDEVFDNYWLREVQNVGRIDRTDAILAVHTFVRDSALAPYDTILDLARRSRPLPFAAENCFRVLRRRFPGRIVQTEKEELFAKAYYFGAIRPNLYIGANSGMMYPFSRIEDGDLPKLQRRAIIERFIELTRRYPEDGRRAAGFCRSHVNPFLTYAIWADADSVKREMYRNVLHMQVARLGRDFEGYAPDDGKTWNLELRAELQLGDAAGWLSMHDREYLESLDKAGWKAICEAQNLHPYYVAQQFGKRGAKLRFKSLDKLARK